MTKQVVSFFSLNQTCLLCLLLDGHPSNHKFDLCPRRQNSCFKCGHSNYKKSHRCVDRKLDKNLHACHRCCLPVFTSTSSLHGKGQVGTDKCPYRHLPESMLQLWRHNPKVFGKLSCQKLEDPQDIFDFLWKQKINELPNGMIILHKRLKEINKI